MLYGKTRLGVAAAVQSVAFFKTSETNAVSHSNVSEPLIEFRIRGVDHASV
jgi:hypothetical protein